MKGQLFVFRLDGGGYGSSLGDVEAPQLHPTVCDLLGIEAAAGVEVQALDVK